MNIIYQGKEKTIQNSTPQVLNNIANYEENKHV